MTYDVFSPAAPEVAERSGRSQSVATCSTPGNSFLGMLNYYFRGASGDIGTRCTFAAMLKQPNPPTLRSFFGFDGKQVLFL